MTRRHLVPFLLVAAGCSGQGQTPGGAASAPPSPAASAVAAAPSPMGASIVAEVVTIDTAGPSLTLREGDVPALKAPGPKDIKPTDRTIRVEPSAAASLAALKPGQRIRVACSGVSAAIAPAPGTSGATGSPAASPAAPAGAAATGAMPASTVPADLAGCDSIVSVTPLESPAP